MVDSHYMMVAGRPPLMTKEYPKRLLAGRSAAGDKQAGNFDCHGAGICGTIEPHTRDEESLVNMDSGRRNRNPAYGTLGKKVERGIGQLVYSLSCREMREWSLIPSLTSRRVGYTHLSQNLRHKSRWRTLLKA